MKSWRSSEKPMNNLIGAWPHGLFQLLKAVYLVARLGRRLSNFLSSWVGMAHSREGLPHAHLS